MFSHNSYDTANEGLLFSIVLGVANVFSCCSRSQKTEEQATYVDIKPSQNLLPQKKGIFATSFEQIPCDGPIYDYQYRTGRRYVTGDNFPRTNDLDIYLARHKSLASLDSSSSLVLATEANLDFHILADQFVDLFAGVSEAQVEELRSQFPNEVAYFLEHGDVKQEFTQSGTEDLEALQELDSSQWINECSDGSDSGESLETSLPQIEPKMKSDLPPMLNVDSSLNGFSPIPVADIEFKHRSAVDMFEEWAAAQSPCVSPW